MLYVFPRVNLQYFLRIVKSRRGVCISEKIFSIELLEEGRGVDAAMGRISLEEEGEDAAMGCDG